MRPPGPTKRQKELIRAEKKKEKEARKEQRKRDKAERASHLAPGEDPDLVGIVPGPQPPLYPPADAGATEPAAEPPPSSGSNPTGDAAQSGRDPGRPGA